MFKFGEDFYDVVGNAWQLTSTKFNFFEGFETHPLYEDFSLPCINGGKHYMILGNSFASSGACGKYEYRNNFRRHFHQFSGIRYVVGKENDEKVEETGSEDSLEAPNKR